MARWTIHDVVDLAKPASANTKIRETLMSPGDSSGHVWEIEVLQDGEAASLDGMYPICFIWNDLYTSGNCLRIVGTRSSNVVRVTFSSSVYTNPGVIRAVFTIGNSNNAYAQATNRLTLADTLFYVQPAMPSTVTTT